MEYRNYDLTELNRREHNRIARRDRRRTTPMVVTGKGLIRQQQALRDRVWYHRHAQSEAKLDNCETI